MEKRLAGESETSFANFAARELVSATVSLLESNGTERPFAYLSSVLSGISGPEVPDGFNERLADVSFPDFVKFYRRIEYVRIGEERLSKMRGWFFSHFVNFEKDREKLQSLYSDYKEYVKFARGLSFEKASWLSDYALQNELVWVRSCFSVLWRNRGSVLLLAASWTASLNFVVSKWRRIGKFWLYGVTGGPMSIPNVYMESWNRFWHVVFSVTNRILWWDPEIVAEMVESSAVYAECPFYHDLLTRTSKVETPSERNAETSSGENDSATANAEHGTPAASIASR